MDENFGWGVSPVATSILVGALDLWRRVFCLVGGVSHVSTIIFVRALALCRRAFWVGR